jgi:hypothetical protein
MVLLPKTPILGVAELQGLLDRMVSSGEYSPEWAKGLNQDQVKSMIEKRRELGIMTNRDAEGKVYVAADEDGKLIRNEDSSFMRKDDIIEAYQNNQRIEKAIIRNIKDFYDELEMQRVKRPKRLSMEQKNRIINAAYQEVLDKDAPEINQWNGTKGENGFSVQAPSRNGTSFFYRWDQLDPDYNIDAGGERNSEKRYKVGDEYRFFPLAAIGYTRETLEEYAKNLRRVGFLARITKVDDDKARGTKRFGLYVHPKTNDPEKAAYLLSEIYKSDPTNPQFGNKMRKWLLNDGTYLAPDKPNLVARDGIPTQSNIFGEGSLNNRVRIYNRQPRPYDFRILRRTMGRERGIMDDEFMQLLNPSGEQIGFYDQDGTFITDPMYDSTGRFSVNPYDEYGANYEEFLRNFPLRGVNIGSELDLTLGEPGVFESGGYFRGDEIRPRPVTATDRGQQLFDLPETYLHVLTHQNAENAPIESRILAHIEDDGSDPNWGAWLAANVEEFERNLPAGALLEDEVIPVSGDNMSMIWRSHPLYFEKDGEQYIKDHYDSRMRSVVYKARDGTEVPYFAFPGLDTTQPNELADGTIQQRIFHRKIANRNYNRRIDGQDFRKLEITPKSKISQQIIAGKLRERGYKARVVPVKNGWHVFYRARPGTRALAFDAPEYKNKWRE